MAGKKDGSRRKLGRNLILARQPLTENADCKWLVKGGGGGCLQTPEDRHQDPIQAAPRGHHARKTIAGISQPHRSPPSAVGPTEF